MSTPAPCFEARGYRGIVRDGPSASLLAGQLGYLFEDHPELRTASSNVPAERLNHDDRYARASVKYPHDTDGEVRAQIDEFDARVSVADVDAAPSVYRADDGQRSDSWYASAGIARYGRAGAAVTAPAGGIEDASIGGHAAGFFSSDAAGSFGG